MTTLQDIHWFTFGQDLGELKTLTIWQAIAYIMQNQEGLEEDLEKYKKDFNAIELLEAADYLESYFDNICKINYHKNNIEYILKIYNKLQKNYKAYKT